MKYPKTPELNKMCAVRDKSQAIGTFLDWLSEEKGGDLNSCPGSYEELLAEYFGIDLKKVEKERRKILDYQRELNR